jgi:hypothetical protein
MTRIVQKVAEANDKAKYAQQNRVKTGKKHIKVTVPRELSAR